MTEGQIIELIRQTLNRGELVQTLYEVRRFKGQLKDQSDSKAKSVWNYGDFATLPFPLPDDFQSEMKKLNSKALPRMLKQLDRIEETIIERIASLS